MPGPDSPIPPGDRRVSSQRRNPAALEWTPFRVSSFSRCAGSTPPDVAGEGLVEGGGDVVALAPGPLGHLGPAPQGVLGLVEGRRRIGHQPVVGQGQTGRAAGGANVQRVEGLVEVEVRRRGGGPQHPGVGQPDPDGVAGEEDPAGRVVQSEVVLGVPGESTVVRTRPGPTRISSPSSSTWIRSAGVGSSRP
jgi:hypothetical protein